MDLFEDEAITIHHDGQSRAQHFTQAKDSVNFGIDAPAHALSFASNRHETHMSQAPMIPSKCGGSEFGVVQPCIKGYAS